MGAKQSKTTKASLDNKDFPIVQITYLERVSEAVIATPYGFHCNPPKNTPALLITLDRDEASQFIIPLNIGIRPKGLKEGEDIVGNFVVGSTIKFDKDGNINVVCKGNLNATVEGSCTATIAGNTDITCPQTTINGDVIINGNLTANALTSLLNLTFLGGGSGEIPAGITIDNKGDISGTGNISSNGKDVATHVHSGVQSGGSNTGQPV